MLMSIQISTQPNPPPFTLDIIDPPNRTPSPSFLSLPIPRSHPSPPIPLPPPSVPAPSLHTAQPPTTSAPYQSPRSIQDRREDPQTPPAKPPPQFPPNFSAADLPSRLLNVPQALRYALGTFPLAEFMALPTQTPASSLLSPSSASSARGSEYFCVSTRGNGRERRAEMARWFAGLGGEGASGVQGADF